MFLFACTPGKEVGDGHLGQNDIKVLMKANLVWLPNPFQ